jgi:hypothetical protein
MAITTGTFGGVAKNAAGSEGDVGRSAESRGRIRKNQTEKRTEETNQPHEPRC